MTKFTYANKPGCKTPESDPPRYGTLYVYARRQSDGEWEKVSSHSGMTKIGTIPRSFLWWTWEETEYLVDPYAQRDEAIASARAAYANQKRYQDVYVEDEIFCIEDFLVKTIWRNGRWVG